MFTLYWIAFHVGWCSIVWTVSNGAHRTGASRSHTSNIVPKRLKVKVWWTNSIPYSWIFASVLADSSPLSYLFISATVRIPVYTAPWPDTEPIRYADAPSSTSARRSFAPKSPLVCVNWSPIRYGSRTGAKDIGYCVNITGSFSPRHAQSLVNGRAGNEAQEVAFSPSRAFSRHRLICLCVVLSACQH